MSQAPTPAHPFQIRDFRFLLMGRMCTTLGQYATMIILGWQAYSIARETMPIREATAQLGFIGLAQFVPLFLLTPVSGWVADHFDRRFVAAATICILGLAVGTMALATYEGWVSLPLIFSVAVLVGIARCFHQPAISSVTPRIVPAPLLPRAIATSSMAWQTSAIVGPALGGAIFAVTPWGSYALALLLFGITLVCLLQISPLPPASRDRSRHPVRQMIDGLQYVHSNKLVLGAITLDLMAVLLAGATALLPVYARDILHVGASGLGQLAAAPGVGALASATMLNIFPLENNVGNKMLGAVALFGGATILFGLTAYMPEFIAFWVALGALFLCGITDMVSVFVRSSLIQIYTPDAMRGRVSSVSTMTISASNELGEAESGFLAAAIGPVATVVLGGIGAIIVTLAWSRIFPQLGQARRFDMHGHAPDIDTRNKTSPNKEAGS